MTAVEHDPFHWAKRVRRADIRRLYESDARGLLDEDLLEKLSFQIYERISDMVEILQAQTTGVVKCRSCGWVLTDRFRMGADHKSRSLRCSQCGWLVTCGEYFDSYNGKRLLPGSVPEVFLGFLTRWPTARSVQEKMILLDWLIHEFHTCQGIPGRPVAENVIQGTAEQVSDLILELAYGQLSTPGLCSTEEWTATFDHPVRKFRRCHSRADLHRIGKELGITGCQNIPDDVLVNQILELAPELAGS